MLKFGETQRLTLGTIDAMFLVGDRITQDLLTAIGKQLTGCKRILAGYLLTETGSFPLIGDEGGNLIKGFNCTGKGYKVIFTEMGLILFF